MSNQIFWIASYPKSGNTLLRSIIISLFFTEDGRFKIEHFKRIGQFEETERIKKNLSLFKDIPKEKINNENLFKNILNLQKRESLFLDKDKYIFFKTHSGLFNVYGYPFTTEIISKGLIYVIRDPRDVCISWSKHFNKSLDESIEFMINENQGLHWNETDKKSYFSNSTRPMSYLSSWDRHVKSWCTNNWNKPKKIIKYEDLVYNKLKITNELIIFFEKNYDLKIENKLQKINNIIEYTDFNKMKNDEIKKGFSEANENSNFFSVGKKEQWKNKLNMKQVSTLENKFGELMKYFNYKLLTKND